jgi:hypothetical protein
LAQQKKSRKVGPPKLPKGEAKGKIVPVHLTHEQFKALSAAARVNNQTVLQRLRSTVNASFDF